jgi:apolipoprotein N-acyltransferase
VSSLLRAGVAAASGIAAAVSFEPFGWVALLPLAVAGLSWSVHGLRGPRAFAVGTAFGLTFMAALLPWLQVIGVDAWLGLSLLEGLFFGVLGALLARVGRLRAAPVWQACCWMAVELLRSEVPWGGFPWGRLAFATVDTPLASAMPWVGVSGTGFLVALLGATLAWAVTGRRGARIRAVDGPGRRTVVSGVAAVVLLCVAAGLLPTADGAPTSAGTVRVAAVQGNVPGEGMDAFSERRVVLENHVEATHRLAERVARGDAEQPDLVLWPESSTDLDPYEHPDVFADIQGAVDAIGVPVLVGAMVGGPGPVDVRNQGIVWEPGTGPSDSYSKMHPVPFGEYIPHRAQLAQLFERLDQIPRDMVPGTEAGLLDMAGTPVGDVICFEVAYDDVVHEVVRQGAQLLTVQTNNATYMGTGQIEQQFAIARLRAMETGRYVVVVATNGVSGIVAPDGRLLDRAPVRRTVILEDDVPLLTSLTPAVRLGRWGDVVLALAAALALGASLVLERRGRRDPDSPREPEPGPSLHEVSGDAL